MPKKRLEQLVYFVIAAILTVVHYFWGHTILQFLAKYPLYWGIAGIATLMLIDSIIAFIKNTDLRARDQTKTIRAKGGIIPGEDLYRAPTEHEDSSNTTPEETDDE